jgi:hypothetical protein
MPGWRADPDSSDRGPGCPGSGRAQSGRECAFRRSAAAWRPAPPRRERCRRRAWGHCQRVSRRGRPRSALSQPWRPRALLRLARLAVDLVTDNARRHLRKVPDQGVVDRRQLRPQDVTQEALRHLEHERGPALAWVAIRAQTVTPSPAAAPRTSLRPRASRSTAKGAASHPNADQSLLSGRRPRTPKLLPLKWKRFHQSGPGGDPGRLT